MTPCATHGLCLSIGAWITAYYVTYDFADQSRDAVKRCHAFRLLFTFLDHAGVEATNNLAARQLRPAVIARKVSCGQRTRRGADAWQVLASLAATCRQRAESFVDLVAAKMACPAR